MQAQALKGIARLDPFPCVSVATTHAWRLVSIPHSSEASSVTPWPVSSVSSLTHSGGPNPVNYQGSNMAFGLLCSAGVLYR